MNRIEGLMVAICLTSFGAGLGVGMAVPAAASDLDGRPGEQAREQDIARYREQFDLRPNQVSDLRAILQSLDDEKVRIVKSADYAELPPRLKDQWMHAQQQTDRRIEYILDEKQRAKYHALNPNK